VQRLSWDLLRQSWVDEFFFEPLSDFILRLHEDRGAETLAVAVFSPEGEDVPPASPPVDVLVLYRNPVDFLKDNLFLREHDPSGMLNFFSYGIDSFRRMVEGANPLSIQALKTGLIVFEIDNAMEDFVSSGES